MRDPRASRPFEQQKSNGQHQAGRLSIWVHKLEKINTNPSDSENRYNGRDGQTKQTAITGPIADGEKLCFKVSSLITELLLILFAVCLLLIALVVIISKKVPSFMESYEIVPMVLFILCIALAAFSFVRWLASKITRQIPCCLRSRSQLSTRQQQPQKQQQKQQQVPKFALDTRQSTFTEQSTRFNSSTRRDTKKQETKLIVINPPVVESSTASQRRENGDPTQGSNDVADKTNQQSHHHHWYVA